MLFLNQAFQSKPQISQKLDISALYTKAAEEPTKIKFNTDDFKILIPIANQSIKFVLWAFSVV